MLAASAPRRSARRVTRSLAALALSLAPRFAPRSSGVGTKLVFSYRNGLSKQSNKRIGNVQTTTRARTQNTNSFHSTQNTKASPVDKWQACTYQCRPMGKQHCRSRVVASSPRPPPPSSAFDMKSAALGALAACWTAGVVSLTALLDARKDTLRELLSHGVTSTMDASRVLGQWAESLIVLAMLLAVLAGCVLSVFFVAKNVRVAYRSWPISESRGSRRVCADGVVMCCTFSSTQQVSREAPAATNDASDAAAYVIAVADYTVLTSCTFSSTQQVSEPVVVVDLRIEAAAIRVRLRNKKVIRPAEHRCDCSFTRHPDPVSIRRHRALGCAAPPHVEPLNGGSAAAVK